MRTPLLRITLGFTAALLMPVTAFASTVSIQDDPDPFDVCLDGDIEYEIRIMTTGNANDNTDVRAFLDPDTTFVSASNGGHSIGRDQVSWTNLTVTRNSSRTLRLRVRPRSSVRDGDVIRLRVSVDGDDDRESTRVYRRGCEGNVQKKIGEGIYSPTGVDDYFRNKFINPAPHPDDYFRSGGGLTVSRSIDRGESYPGGLVTYTLTVRNLSRISIHNIVATVTFQNGGQISIEDPGGGSVQHPSLRWNVGTLVPGGEKRIRYRARMGSHLRHGHQVHNSAYITASNAPSVTTGTVVDIVQLMPQTGLGGLSESFGKTRDLLKPIPSITTDTSGNGTVFVWFVISLTGIGLGGLLSKKMFL